MLESEPSEAPSSPCRRHGGLLGGITVAVLSCLPSICRPTPAQRLASDASGEGGAEGGAICGDGFIDLAAGEECDPGSAPIAEGGVCSARCKVVCTGLKWRMNDHCYELRPAAKNLQTTAETACNDLSSHVVTFASESELAAAAQYVHGDAAVAAESFWVGLVDDAYR